MLERTREIHPKTVRSQNELITAMENNETLIYVVGSYADEIKGTAIKNNATRGIWGAGKVIGAIGAFVINPLFGLACFGLSALNDAMAENFKNYKITVENDKHRIVLLKTKGTNAFRNKKLDTIIE